MTASERRLLAFYRDETDDEQRVSKGETATVLAEPGVAAGAISAADGPEAVTRLWLRAAAASAMARGSRPTSAWVTACTVCRPTLPKCWPMRT